MKRYIMAGLLFAFPAFSSGSDVQVWVNGKNPSEAKCFVSCPSENGFPNVPQEYPCNDMPEIGKDCIISVMAGGDCPDCPVCPQPEKVTLERIIMYLQILTGKRED